MDEKTETEGRWLDEPQKRFYALRKDLSFNVEMKNLERDRDVEYVTFTKMICNLENSIEENHLHESVITDKSCLLNQFEENDR